jgi:hypothetical protein
MDDRLYLKETVWRALGIRVFSPAIVVSHTVIGLVLCLGIAGLWRLLRSRKRMPLMIFLLTAALFMVYVGMIVLGRMNVRTGPFTLTRNSYYAYFGLLLAFIVVFAAAQEIATQYAGLRALLFGGLIALAAVGAEQVRQVNSEIAHELHEVTKTIAPVEEFVEKHWSEPAFSFAIDYEASDEIPLSFDIPITEVIFSRWMNSSDPKYILIIRDGRALVK